jgi:hypothetical protein
VSLPLLWPVGVSKFAEVWFVLVFAVQEQFFLPVEWVVIGPGLFDFAGDWVQFRQSLVRSSRN